MIEKTFVLIKPDAVERGLVGEIISTFEKANLKIVAMKVLTPTREIVSKHYPETTEWLSTVGKKTLEGYAVIEHDVKRELGTNDTVKIGQIVRNWLIEFITSGNGVAMVIEGNSAVTKVRQLCGNTIPIFADPTTIRGRFSSDSPDLATIEKRPLYNLIHASGNAAEAAFEITLWFPEFSHA